MCVSLIIGSQCELPVRAVDWDAADALTVLTDHTPQALFVEEVLPGRVVRRCFDVPWVYEVGTWPEGCACTFKNPPELVRYLDRALSMAGELRVLFVDKDSAGFDESGHWGSGAFLGDDQPSTAAEPLELGTLDHDVLHFDYPHCGTIHNLRR